jgi:hypothetical protein
LEIAKLQDGYNRQRYIGHNRDFFTDKFTVLLRPMFIVDILAKIYNRGYIKLKFQ